MSENVVNLHQALAQLKQSQVLTTQGQCAFYTLNLPEVAQKSEEKKDAAQSPGYNVSS